MFAYLRFLFSFMIHSMLWSWCPNSTWSTWFPSWLGLCVEMMGFLHGFLTDSISRFPPSLPLGWCWSFNNFSGIVGCLSSYWFSGRLFGGTELTGKMVSHIPVNLRLIPALVASGGRTVSTSRLLCRVFTLILSTHYPVWLITCLIRTQPTFWFQRFGCMDSRTGVVTQSASWELRWSLNSFLHIIRPMNLTYSILILIFSDVKSKILLLSLLPFNRLGSWLTLWLFDDSQLLSSSNLSLCL